MKPIVVDSTQCHLWTDALHAQALARQARNKWDRGTYVRFCVTTAWTALETSCQDALADNSIGYSFKANLDRAVANAQAPAIDWGKGIWQRVSQVQNIRKDYIHRYLSLSDMFPDASVADDVVSTVRDAVKDIYRMTGKVHPEWVEICEVSGWDTQPQVGIPTLAQSHLGASFDDPNTTRVFIVINGEEKLTSVFPLGHDTSDVVSQLLESVKVPIEAIRVYDAGQLVEDNRVMMRGN